MRFICLHIYALFLLRAKPMMPGRMDIKMMAKITTVKLLLTNGLIPKEVSSEDNRNNALS